MEENSNLAVPALLVAEGALNLDQGARRGAREGVLAHRDGRVAVDVELVIVKLDGLSPLAAVDGKARVLVVALVHGTTANKVRHGIVGCGAEGVRLSFRGLEEHVGMAVAIQRARAVARRRNVVALR